MTAEERLVEGPKIHELRESVTAAIAGKKEALESAALTARLASEQLDMTLPAPIEPPGSVHQDSQVMHEPAEIYADLRYSGATGPAVADDKASERRGGEAYVTKCIYK